MVSSRVNRRIKKVLRDTRTLDLISRLTAADRVHVMMYHGFCAGSERDSRFPKLLPIDVFEEHLRIFARYGRPCSLQEVLAGAGSGIAVTFDDGYANNYELAFPVLEKHRFPATVFLTTGFLDRTVPLWSDWLEFLVMSAPRAEIAIEWRGAPVVLELDREGAAAKVIPGLKQRLRMGTPDEIHEFLRGLEARCQAQYNWEVMPEQLRPLRWEDVRRMRQSRLVSFGAHTVSHPVLSRCSSSVQRYEVTASKRRVEEELGVTCFSFAYPFGKADDYTGMTQQIVRQAGYTLALTAECGFTRPSSWNPYALRRWGADIGTDDLSFIVSGASAITGCFRRGPRQSCGLVRV